MACNGHDGDKTTNVLEGSKTSDTCCPLDDEAQTLQWTIRCCAKYRHKECDLGFC